MRSRPTASTPSCRSFRNIRGRRVTNAPFAILRARVESMASDNEELDPMVSEALRDILTRVGDKWTIVTLTALGNRRMRLRDLHRAIEGVSQRMLVVTLRNLERDGVVLRVAYPTVPPRVDYELSQLGRSLRAVLKPVGAWVLKNRSVIEEARRQFDQRTQPVMARALTQK